MKDNLLYDKNGTAYDEEGNAYDKQGQYVPTPHDHVLDKGIARAVCILQAAGVETFASCQGGEGHVYDYPTIRFGGTPRCGHLALGIALKECWSIKSLRRYWTVCENEVTGPNWELVLYHIPDPCQLRKPYPT